MISSKRKRIVFCGNYRWWTPQWNYLDDDSISDMSADEFFGADNMRLNGFISSTERENLTTATSIMKMNRVIDSSEYVVRCNHGKTSNPTVGFQYEKDYPASIYGSNTDIIGIRPAHGKSILDGGNLTEELIPNHFNPFAVSMGLPSKRLGNLSLKPNMSDEEKGIIFRSVLKNYGSKMVACRNDEQMKQEVWIHSNLICKPILNLIQSDDKSDLKLLSEKIKSEFESIKSSLDYIQNIHGLNIKQLSVGEYFELCEEVYLNSISYEKLKSMIGYKKWAKSIFEYKKGDPNWIRTEDERSQWMMSVKNNYHMNRGLELIWMMLVDERFKDYDKYIIGTMGINECFKLGLNCEVNFWGEYFWMSKNIKGGKLKYLPEHVDVLYDEYETETMKTGMNLGTRYVL